LLFFSLMAIHNFRRPQSLNETRPGRGKATIRPRKKMGD